MTAERALAGAGSLLILWLVVVTAVRPSTAYQSAASPVASPAAAGTVYLALGDSVAAGVGAGRPAIAGYVALVHGYLERQTGRPVELVNLAVPGATTDDLIADGQLDRAREFFAAARQTGRRANPVTLTIGANDLIRAGAETSAREDALATVATNLRLILGNLAAAVGATPAPPDLVVTTYYDPSGTDPTLPGTDGWWIARLNDVIAREAAAAGARTADVAERFRAAGSGLTRYPSDVHPTDAGHQAIADEVWRTLGYDVTPPAIRFDRPDPGPLARPIPTVAATVTDQVGVVIVHLLVDGAPSAPLRYIPELDAYAALWDSRPFPPGPHTLTVQATDAAGNAATAELTVVVPADPAATPVLGRR